MKLPTLKNKDGFTIIEVVLVLAIAGLIFLIVFLALPALQRNQRDTQRRNDVGRALTAVTNYSANNNNAVPEDQSEVDVILDDYLNIADDDFADPSEGDYPLTYGGPADSTGYDLGTMYYEDGTRCGDGGIPDSDHGDGTAVGSRTFTVSTTLEGGGVYCQDNR
jgi:prepilin-type N-terminal cleavage/methylation domain-containing protein